MFPKVRQPESFPDVSKCFQMFPKVRQTFTSDVFSRPDLTRPPPQPKVSLITHPIVENMDPVQAINSFISSIDYADQPEGSSIPEQIQYYLELLHKNPSIKRIVEIGFNLGISAAAFLAARPDTHVVSIDIGAHAYVLPAKRNIDKHFPGRHSLVVGDSTTTVPFLHGFFNNPNPVDLFMIDGYHVEPVPRIDLSNALVWCGPETYIIVDDVCATYGGEGVNDAVRDALSAGTVKFVEHKSAQDRGWVLLKRGPNAG